MCGNIALYYDIICSWGGNVEKPMEENRARRVKNNCTSKNKESSYLYKIINIYSISIIKIF